MAGSRKTAKTLVCSGFALLAVSLREVAGSVKTGLLIHWSKVQILHGPPIKSITCAKSSPRRIRRPVSGDRSVTVLRRLGLVAGRKIPTAARGFFLRTGADHSDYFNGGRAKFGPVSRCPALARHSWRSPPRLPLIACAGQKSDFPIWRCVFFDWTPRARWENGGTFGIPPMPKSVG